MGEESKTSVESGLSTFQDEEERIVTYPVTNVPTFVVANPFPDQTPRQMLERWYQINQKTYTTTSAATMTHFPIDDLFQKENIRFCLQTYKYFRFATIEFRLQYSTVPMVFGWLGASTLPFVLPQYANYYQLLSHTDTVLFDLSCQQDVTFKSPWISPEQWIDLPYYYNTGTSACRDAVNAAHRCTVYNPVNPVGVLDTTATNTVVLQVFARFCGTEVAGHIDAIVDNSFRSQMKGSFMGMMGDYSRQDRFTVTGRDDEAETVSMVETAAAPKVAVSPSYDPDEPELKPSLYGSIVRSNPKYVLGSGNQSTGGRNMTLLDIMRVPTLIYDGVADEALQVITGPRDRWSRISFLSQMFRMWRGSVEYTFVFFTSPFVTARFNIVLVYPGDALDAVSELGNKIIQDVTIRGTTRVQFTVPYLFAVQWHPTIFQADSLVPMQDPYLTLKFIQPPESIGDVVPPPIPLLIYETAAPDFRFRSLVNPSVDQVSPPFRSQMRTADFVKSRKLFKGSTSPLTYGDDSEMSLSQLLGRWSFSNPDRFRFPMEIVPPGNPKMPGVFSTICHLFYFYSGQVKHKTLVPPADPSLNDPYSKIVVKMDNFIATQAVGVFLTQRAEDGMTVISNQVTQIIECVVPYLSVQAFEPICAATDFQFTPVRHHWLPLLMSDTVSVIPYWDLVAGGPDFTLYYLVPPPPFSMWPSVDGAPMEVKDPTNFMSDTVSMSDDTSVSSLEKAI